MSLVQNIPVYTAAFLGHKTDDLAYQIAQGSSHQLAVQLEEVRRSFTVAFSKLIFLCHHGHLDTSN